jgi:hypothetical protein
MVFNATFNNSSVISWRSVLLVEENRVPGENCNLGRSVWDVKYKHHTTERLVYYYQGVKILNGKIEVVYFVINSYRMLAQTLRKYNKNVIENK